MYYLQYVFYASTCALLEPFYGQFEAISGTMSLKRSFDKNLTWRLSNLSRNIFYMDNS